MKLKYKSIIIVSQGIVKELGNQDSPILEPFTEDIPTIRQMLISGHEIYEVREDGSKTRLTLNNVDKGDFIIITPGDDSDNPLVDGQLHVPETRNDSDGKFLKAGESPGKFGWSYIVWDDIHMIPEDYKSLSEKYAIKGHSHGVATKTTPGFMSAADKIALDGITKTIDDEIATKTTDIIVEINANDKANINSSKISVAKGNSTETLDKAVEGINNDISNLNKPFYYPIFCVNSLLMSGVQPLKLEIPFNSAIQSISALCEHKGNEDVVIQIEKISAADFAIGKDAWTPILDISGLRIRTGNPHNDPYTIISDVLSKNDILRLNVITDGNGVRGLNIKLTVRKN